MTVGRIICILIGYAIGLFQTGYIYGKTQHIDIREHGSGNVERPIPCVHLVLKQERSRSRGIVEKQSLPFLSPG